MEKQMDEVCENCGAMMKTKYLIRIELRTGMLGPVLILESTTKNSVVGWMKHLVDEYDFETIYIYNLINECPVHERFWKKR